jgi:aspartate/methionine/tyrosine aminotransferase
MPKTSLRTASFAESVIRGMTRLANECGAINLSQGFPDFHPPEQVLQALERIAREGPHQYAVTWGAPKP